MKEFSRIKLTQLDKVELKKKELNRLLGGGNCCICNPTSKDSYNANIAGGSSGLIPGDGGGGAGGGTFG